MAFQKLVSRSRIVIGVGVAICGLLAGGYWYSRLGDGPKVADGPVGPICFATQSLDAGTVVTYDSGNHFRPIKVTYSFTVWDKSPVTITKVTSQCALCLRFDKSLVGKELRPGSSHFLTGELTPEAKTVTLTYRALVETSPATPHPLIIEARCRGTTRPVVSPTEISIETGIGEKPLTKIHVAYVRSKSEPELKIKEAACELSGFSIIEQKLTTSRGMSHPKDPFPPIVDEIYLTLQFTTEYNLGVHKANVVLHWGGDEPKVELPVMVRVVHPIRPKLPELFCGVFQPLEDWKGEVVLIRRDKADTSCLKTIMTSKPYILASVDKRFPDRIDISFKTPSMRGRHDESIELVFKDTRYPNLRIPVSFVVQ
jgi:hypothetical protein